MTENEKAISILEELQQYRALGTPEELKELKERAFDGMELAQIAAALMRLKEYERIGTPEECRAAMEQEAKKVIEKYKAKAPEDIEAYGEDAVFGYCPVCGCLQNTVWNTKYCGDCGQRLDWSDEE